MKDMWRTECPPGGSVSLRDRHRGGPNQEVPVMMREASLMKWTRAGVPEPPNLVPSHTLKEYFRMA